MPIILFPCVLIDSFSMLLVPEFSRYYAKQDDKRIQQVIKFIFMMTTSFSVFVSIIFFLSSNHLALIFYHDASIGSYIKLICPLIIFMYLDIVIDSTLKGLDQQFFVMLINVIDLILSVIIIYFFVPILGFKGYIISIYTSEILNFTLSGLKLYQIQKKGRGSI